MGQSQKLREKIFSAPNACGVYLMRDRFGKVLYVGKANALKKRLFSYLKDDLTGKTAALMAKVEDIEFRLSANESMALLLESSLIHELKPRYNVSLRDDKSFPWIKISQERFPLVGITRKQQDPGARYFGPYTDAKLLKNALKIIRSSFTYRTCKQLPKKSCIYYRINLCPAPCTGKISQQEYRRIIDKIVLILEGRVDALIKKLTKLMYGQSKVRDFESAASLRDQIAVLSQMSAASGKLNYQAELEDLKNKLNLKDLPRKIEGFDVSNLSGKQAVGAMVSFYNGVADKNNYRRFRIKSFTGIDDYKMLAELIQRRYSRLARENKSLPDLLLIDGGRGHLLTAAQELKNLHLAIPLVSIAKEKENIYSSQKSKVINFTKDALGLNLIRRIRDEAHRFALGYHRLLRGKDLLK